MVDPDRGLYVMVGDGSYLMLSSEIVTSIQEGRKLTIVPMDNHGYKSIGRSAVPQARAASARASPSLARSPCPAT